MNDVTDLNSLMRPRKVCVCRSVDRATIEKAVHDGAHSLAEVQKCTSAATNCGTCLPQVLEIFHETMEKIKSEKDGQNRLPFSNSG